MRVMSGELELVALHNDGVLALKAPTATPAVSMLAPGGAESQMSLPR